MVMRIARDEWLYPNMNTGGVVEFDLERQSGSSLSNQATTPPAGHLGADTKAIYI